MSAGSDSRGNEKNSATDSSEDQSSGSAASSATPLSLSGLSLLAALPEL
jgi:hypothetical protein